MEHEATAGRRGNRDLHEEGGHVLFVELVQERELGAFMDRAVASDARVLPVRRNRAGVRDRSLASIAEDCKEEAFTGDWPIPGPRTVGWCLRYLVQEGVGLDAHHERFRSACKLDLGSWGVLEHSQLTLHIKHALYTDQWDPCNSSALELMFRRLQTIEYSHAERAREAEAKAVPNSARLSLEEQLAFAGTSRTHSSLMVCPALLDYVKTEVEREAALTKNLVKAREAREALAKDKKEKK